MLPLAFLGALLSDHSGYYIGRSIGPRLHQTAYAIKRVRQLKKAEESIKKYGVFAIFIGRFVTPIRSIVPLVTGVSGMDRVRYSIFDFIACATWTVCLGLLVVGIDKLWD
jgi:membrane protein DedA with SNARE-associated domain